MRHFAHLLQIFRHAGHKPPGFLIVKEAEREFLQMVKNPATHFRFNGNSQHMAPVIHDVLQAGVQHIDKQQSRRSP